jgi:hypothetical protein
MFFLLSHQDAHGFNFPQFGDNFDQLSLSNTYQTSPLLGTFFSPLKLISILEKYYWDNGNIFLLFFFACDFIIDCVFEK